MFMKQEKGGSVQGICGGVVIEQFPEPGKGLPRHYDGGALAVGLLLRYLKVQAPRVGLRIAEEYLALYLHSRHQNLSGSCRILSILSFC